MKVSPVLACLFAMTLTSVTTTFGQTASSEGLSPQQRDLVIQRLLKRVQDFYVLQDQAKTVADHVRSRQTEGSYDDLTDPRQLARQLTLDLRQVSQDAHFGLLYDPGTFTTMAQELAPLDGPNSRKVLKRWLEDDDGAPDLGDLTGDERQNFFFSKLEVLDGNVGYLKLDRIPALGPAKATVDAAMGFLAHTDSMIIDLRGNPGGVGGFIPYFMSYFFPEGGTYLYRREFQAVGVIDEYHTEENLPQKRLAQIPLFILIDPATGSAARNLAYTLQSFERALLIGEASGDGHYRGAHSAGLFPLSDGLLAVVPIGRVVNARTNTNWREGGVQPDVVVDSAEALTQGHRLALQAMLDDNTDEAVVQELNQALETLNTKKTANSGSKETGELDEFVGVYGQRTISLDDGTLMYSREGMGAKLNMRPLEKDLFALVLPRNARSAGAPPNVRFDRNEQDVVVGFSLINADGSIMETVLKNRD